MENPLLVAFDTAPFEKVKNEHFKPAFLAAIDSAKAEIDMIAENPEPTSFENTIEALEYSGKTLDRISSIFFNLNAAETNPEMQQIAQEVSPLLSQFSNDINLNQKLFERIKTVYESQQNLSLNEEQTTLLEKRYKSFSRNGANLGEKDKKRLREIDASLAQLKLKFGENVLAETNAYELHITDEGDLKGLPEGVIEAAAQTAQSKEKEGWVFTLDYPSYVPFMKYAKNRELRKTLSAAFGSKGFHGDERDNQENVLQIVALRHERANLLGYSTHADFVLEERMAGTPEKVTSFLNELMEKAQPAAKAEFAEMEAFAKAMDGIDTLQKWDGAYYAEKLKQQKFSLDDEKLKPYFKLENVIDGVFKVAEKLFDLRFVPVSNVEKYHEDVKTYEVKDSTGSFISLFYADFHPRPGKRGGAWMTSYKPQYQKDGENHRPHVSNVCNFT
ncbi:MAG: M3 family metallopeptidase, partial [Bacteroidota bacterium]